MVFCFLSVFDRRGPPQRLPQTMTWALCLFVIEKCFCHLQFKIDLAKIQDLNPEYKRKDVGIELKRLSL